jgi:hypothetical protein
LHVHGLDKCHVDDRVHPVHQGTKLGTTKMANASSENSTDVIYRYVLHSLSDGY